MAWGNLSEMARMEEWFVPRADSRLEGREHEKYALVAFLRQNED